MNTPLTIILTSNEPWGDVWFSKQHYANELSKLGHNVYFLNPPKPWTLKNLFIRAVKSEKINEHLIVINIQNAFPIRFFPSLFLKINDWLNCRTLARQIHQKEVIFWHFDPFRFVHISNFLAKRIYHVVDPYFHLFTDNLLAKKVDIIALVSPYYRNYYEESKTVLIPHGISQEESKLEPIILEQVRNEVGQNYVIFVGTLNPDVDLNLIQNLGEAGINTLIIGNIPENKETLEALVRPNIRLLGARPSQLLKYYIYLAKVCIIPYKTQLKGNIHRTPLKLVTYLAQKRPIVSTLNYEFKELENTWIYTRKDLAFIETVSQLINSTSNQNPESINQYLEQIVYPTSINKTLSKLYEKS